LQVSCGNPPGASATRGHGKHPADAFGAALFPGLAVFFGVTLAQLRGEEPLNNGLLIEGTGFRLESKRGCYDADNAAPAPKLAAPRRVPVVGTAQLGDNGHWAELEYPVGHGDGHIEFASRDANAYALRCRGDSMRPRILDGEYVIVEPNGEPIPGDEVLVKAVDGRVMVKTFLYRREGRLHLMSANAAHPPQAIPLDQVDKIHPVVAIVKKALWHAE